MTGEEQAVPRKQRVRTGCLTCRGRRRKCDERKPRCENCEAKDLVCRYGVNLTFVQSQMAVPHQRVSPSIESSPIYSRIRFMNDEPKNASRSSTEVVASSTSDALKKQDSARDSDMTSNVDDDILDSAPLEQDFNVDDEITVGATSGTITLRETVSRDQERSVSITGQRSGELQDVAERDNGDPTPGMFGWNESIISPVNVFYTSPHSRTSFDLPQAQFLTAVPATTTHVSILVNIPKASDKRDVEMLRHYRYKIAPWIDIGDPESTFGIAVLLISKEFRPLYHAVLSIAAYQQYLLNRQDEGDALSLSSQHRSEAQSALEISEQPIARATIVLFALTDVLSTEPKQWRPTILTHLASLGGTAFNAFDGDLNEVIFWLFLRIGKKSMVSAKQVAKTLTEERLDLAAAIMANQPPILSFLSSLPPDIRPERATHLFTRRRSPRQNFQQSLFLLACALVFAFDPHRFFLRSGYADPESIAASNAMPLSSRWMSIWNENQKWYRDRPPELQQIFDIRGSDVERFEPDDNSSFPIVLFTNSLAMVANFVHHITALILLTYKPRLVKAVAAHGSSTSPIFHAQHIAGIAVCNDISENWDPILVAGLLLAAKRMSHGSQHVTILDALHRIMTMTGMKLEHEIEALQTGWKASEHD